MVEYGETFWKQTSYYKDHGIPYDKATVINVASECMDNGVALAAVDGEKVCGLMLCLVTPFPMNAKYRQAVEWVFYVDYKYRNTGLGERLIKRAEVKLHQMGVSMLTMVALTNVTPDTAIRLYEKMGYTHSETSMTKDIT